MKPHDSFTDKDKTDSEIYKKTGIMPIEDEALAEVAGGGLPAGWVVDTEVEWPNLWADAYYDIIGSGFGRGFVGGSLYGDERYWEVKDKLVEWRMDMGKTGDLHSVPDWVREFWDPNKSPSYKGG